jgi:preprotein translocase subunit SecD
VAPPAGTLRVGRYFAALLAIIAVLYTIVFWPGARHTPKLGIDLAGGTEIIFTAKSPHKHSTPSSSDMNQAKEIMTSRVNGTGVTEATVVIQGNNQLVVSIPGKTDEDASKLGAAAVLNLRPAVAPGVAVDCTTASTAATAGASSTPSTSTSPTASTTPSGATTSSGASSSSPASAKGSSTAAKSPSNSESASGAVEAARPLGAASPSASATPKSATSASSAKTTGATSSSTPSAGSTATGSTTPSSSASPTATAPPACTSDPMATVAKAGKFTVPLTDTAYNALSSSDQELIQAALGDFNCSAGQDEPDIATSYFVACDTSGTAYLLGPVVVAGKQVSTAAAQAPDFSGSGGSTTWSVNLTLTDSGLKKWASYTGAHNFDTSTVKGSASTCSYAAMRCANYVGFTLDGSVISIPENDGTINSNPTSISGGFTQKTADALADQLKYGALPLSFELESAEPVSATLGSSQLSAGLLAGGIGLILVVIYSLIYYRALGLVTIASLLVSGVLTYGSLVMLATQIDFTLSLAGIAGFIVAVGITADSFVVFFERMKDEVHEGRSARVAIPRAWVRARRTILSADTVSFLAAAILYYFAAGDVRGFAFTLGLSTILDLVVVFLFTHPLVSFLSRFESFGSARFSGLDAIRGGPAISEMATAGRKSARSSKSATESAPTAAAATATAVLDAPETETEDTAEDTAGSPDSSEESSEETIQRRQVTPEPGSAAERAAARRAKMREEKNDGKGKS